MTSTNPPLGTVVGGKYRLVRQLGEGGMGTVFEAQNEVTLKRVAIKVMHADLTKDEQVAARMMREAQTSSRVRHPNVVDVYDAGHDGSSMFLVMEYLEGEPFGQAVKRGELMVHEAIALLVDAMRGVAAAHRVGVIHRDIKPDNIFLAREGDSPMPVPKVLDFGVSKLTDESSLRLTRTDVTIGTPLYMSYEQLSGMRDEVDARADVYAFGVILYEILTGRPPHQANTLAQLAILIASAEPPCPRDLRPETPPALDHIIRHAIAKHREQRTKSLEVLMDELTPFTHASGFKTPLAVSAPVAAGASPTTQQDTKDGKTVELITGDRLSAPAAPTAPSLPTQRSSRKRLLGVGMGLAAVASLFIALSSQPPDEPTRGPSPLPRVVQPPAVITKQVDQVPPQTTTPTQVTPLDEEATSSTGIELLPSGVEVPALTKAEEIAEGAMPTPLARADAGARRAYDALHPSGAKQTVIKPSGAKAQPQTQPVVEDPSAKQFRAGRLKSADF